MIKKHTKVQRKTYRATRQTSKWFNKDLHQLKCLKRKAERQYRKNKTDENEEHYKRLKNRYNFELEKARTNYYNNSISATKDSKMLFKVINKLTGNYKESTYPTLESDKAAADLLASFFVNKVENIRNNIATSNLFATEHQKHTLTEEEELKEFTEISLEDLRLAINAVKNKTC